MIPGEHMWHALRVRAYFSELREIRYPISPKQLEKAIAEGLPCHPCPFGSGRKVFYKSEIDAHLARSVSPVPDVPPRRRPGRPRKSEEARR